MKMLESIDDRYRPEMRKMERALVLSILDAAWKEHLLTMDHLKASVGLRGYAQVDPKVEYKREGMRTYDAMWKSVGERVTDLVFRMEQLDERFVGSTWTQQTAHHAEGRSLTRADAEADGSEEKTGTIRNQGPKIGPNQPCPCGSGKKYKKCCGQ